MFKTEKKKCSTQNVRIDLMKKEKIMKSENIKVKKLITPEKNPIS